MRVLFVIPGDIDTPTGGYRYDRAILAGWRKAGIDVGLLSLPGEYPFPTVRDVDVAVEMIANLPAGDIAVVDGLAGGAAPSVMEALAAKMPLIALVHHPLTLENGLSPDDAKRLLKSEAQGLAHAKAIVTTSPTTAQTVKTLFEVDANDVHFVLPGVERGRQINFRDTRSLRLLSVGSISERKGHDLLIKALSTVNHSDWHLDIVGPTHFDTELFTQLKKLAGQQGLTEHITFHGALSEDALEQRYQAADLFVLASRYEGYGMAYAEAIVRGLPVIGTTAGAVADTVPQNCGILVPPDDVDAFADALSQMMNDAELRARKHRGCLAAEPDFPTWYGSAEAFLTLLRAYQ
ncbi:MAG: glycosyltransferase family 4 protein [Pseudomonadota bacterium]